MDKNQLEFNIAGVNAKLILGDITHQTVDAIVNAANASLAGGGGGDGAIHRAGGLDIMTDTRENHPDGCATGSAVTGVAGNLKAKYVFHAVGPRWSGGNAGEPEQLSSAYNTCPKLADGKEIKTIAFPSISTGIYGFPVQKAAEIAAETLQHHMTDNPVTQLDEVRYVLFDQSTFDAFHHAFENLVGH